MNINQRLVFGILVIVLMLVGCGNLPALSSHPASEMNKPLAELATSIPTPRFGKSSNDIPRIAKSSADSPLGPQTIEDLTQGSALIIEGTVSQVGAVHIIPGTETDDLPDIFTDYRVDVSSVLKSPPGFNEQSIIIYQDGGTYNGVTQVSEDDPPYQIGEQFLFFLGDASDDPIYTAQGEKKYTAGALGRFLINSDGRLGLSGKRNQIAVDLQGQYKVVLENKIAAAIPSPFFYTRNAFERAFLIAEGIVGEPTTRSFEEDGTRYIYTDYPFQVEKVIYDEITRGKNSPRKTDVYKAAPVKKGDTITLTEFGGTANGITKRMAWSQFPKPGSRMLLFFGAQSCLHANPACPDRDQGKKKNIYFPHGDRFLITAKGQLQSVTPYFLSRLYDGRPKKQLENDLNRARDAFFKALDAKSKQLPTEAGPLAPGADPTIIPPQPPDRIPTMGP